MQWRTTVRTDNTPSKGKAIGRSPFLTVCTIVVLFVGFAHYKKTTQIPEPAKKEQGWIANTFDWTTKWGGKVTKLVVAIGPAF